VLAAGDIALARFRQGTVTVTVRLEVSCSLWLPCTATEVEGKTNKTKDPWRTAGMAAAGREGTPARACTGTLLVQFP